MGCDEGLLVTWQGWHVVDWLNYLTFCAAFYLRFLPWAETMTLGFPPAEGAFVNYEPAMWAVIMWRNVIAFNTVVTSMRAFKYLRHVPFMRLLMQTIRNAAQQVRAVSVSVRPPR